MNTEKLYADYNYEIVDNAYATLEERFNDNMLHIGDVLAEKVVDTLAIAAVATTFRVDNETKQMLTEAFGSTLNENEINKILSADKQTLNEMLDAAKQLNTLLREDDLNTRITLSSDELQEAAHTKERIREITSFIEQQTQRITNTTSAPEQKTAQKERKHDIIDF